MIFDLLVLPPDRAVVLKLLLFKTLQVEVSHYFKTYILSVVVYRYISKNLNIVKKVNIFCHSFQKVKPMYYIDSFHIE